MHNSDSSINRRDVYFVIGLLAVTLIIFSPYLFTSPTPYIFPTAGFGTDLMRDHILKSTFIQDTLRATGQFPFWQPYVLSGTPLVGDPRKSVLYPPDWINFTLSLSLPLAQNIVAVFHVWWTALGTYLCLRLLAKRNRIPAFLGGLAFAYSPILMAYLGAGHLAVLPGFAWWPWLWLAFNRFWTSDNLLWMMLLGVTLAMQFFNALNVWIMSLLILAGCTLFYSRYGLKSWFKKTAIGWTVAFAVMVGVSAGQLFPALEMVVQSNRVALTFDEALGQSLPIPILLTSTLFTFKPRVTEWVLFPGVAAIIFALYAVAVGLPRQLRWWAAGLGVLLLICLGRYGLLYWLMFHLVPGFKVLRGSERWWPFVVFGLVMLASYGLDHWLQGKKRPRRITPVVALLALIYIVSAAIELTNPNLFPFEAIPYVIPAVLLCLILPEWKFYLRYPALRAALLVAIVLFEAWLVYHHFMYPHSQAEEDLPTPLVTWLAEHSAPDERVFFPYGGASELPLYNARLRTADGYMPIQLRTYNAYINDAGGCNPIAYSVGAPATRASAIAVKECPVFRPQLHMLKLLNIRYIVLPQSIEHTMDAIPVTFSSDEHNVFDIGEPYGRVFEVTQGNVVLEAECLDQLHRIDPVREAVIESGLPFTGRQANLTIVNQETIANGEIFTVTTDHAGLLIRSETWAPGWIARMDEQQVPVYRSNCALQGVWLEPGEHRVQFEYAPRSFTIGLMISVVSVLILLVIGFVNLRKGISSWMKTPLDQKMIQDQQKNS